MFNVVRNEPAPASLARGKKYDSEDVWEALKKVFHKKCYICETSEPQDINVEHFVPHEGDDNLKYDWENLYFSCGRCNNIKLAKYDDLLDCCDPTLDVVRAIKHLPPSTPYAKKLHVKAQATDDKTKLTAELLDKVFNSENTPNKAVSSAFLRKRVFDQYNLLLSQLNNYYKPMALQEEKDDAVARIKLLLKPSSPYSAFISWCIMEDEELGPMLHDFIGGTE
ncbi:HNH endonuclease [Photobacterium ganghwense]|uniref:HNH endonuclease n=1 Tax=Photobacterium ganghwense TaxID=320778 RepID=UPI001C2D94A7|nr:HNH endonuclease [Photobacterium ganghwense]MBV1839305.1 HNH endonuclease [Photobacterium ganghwense]